MKARCAINRVFPTFFAFPKSADKVCYTVNRAHELYLHPAGEEASV